MQKISYLLFMFVSLFMLSCSDNDTTIVFPLNGGVTYVEPGTTNANGQYAITFGSYTPSSRAIADGGISQLGYDEFKLFAWNNDNAVMNPFMVQAYGVGKYAYVGVNGQDTVYFDNLYGNYRFIGVIPTDLAMVKNEETVVVNNVEAFAVEDEGVTDTPKEFLYSRNIVEKNNYSQAVELNFKHGNAKVYLKFTSNDPNTVITDFKEAITGGSQTINGKIIDDLAEGKTCAWPYAVEPNLTSSQPNPMYRAQVGNTYGNYLASVKDAVNNQFVYYDAQGNVKTDDWVSGNKKNLIQFKLNNNVDKTAFKNGEDAFWNNADTNLKNIFQKAYNEGWRVVRINEVDDYVTAWLVANTNVNYTITTPTVDGIEGIVMLPATSVKDDGSDAVRSTLTKTADVTIPTSSDAVYVETSTLSTVSFSKPQGYVTSTAVVSPTTFYAVPNVANTNGLTVKLSYIYKGTKVYDARVWIPKSKCNFQEGKTYTYTIAINGVGNGFLDSTEADETDPIVKGRNGIGLVVTVNSYEDGVIEEYIIQ